MKRVFLLLLAVFCLVPVSPTAIAQKAGRDPRPATGSVDRSRMKPYIPGQTRLGVRPPQRLIDFARPVGTARRVEIPVRALKSVSPSPSLKNMAPGTIRIQRAKNGTARWVEGELGRPVVLAAPGKQASAEQIAAGAMQVLEPYADVLGLRHPSEELKSVGVSTDPTGRSHVRFQQVFNGVPVWGRELYVHFRPDGSSYLINGAFEPTPAALKTTPALSARSAEEVVVSDLKARQRWAPLDERGARMLGLNTVLRNLVLFPDPTRGMRLAYEVSLHPNLLEWFTYLVDAGTGEILNRFSQHCTIHTTENPSVFPAPQFSTADLTAAGGQFMDATGTDLNGVSQHLRVYKNDTGVYFSLYDLGNFDAAKSSLPDNMVGGAMLLDVRNADLKEEVALYHVTSDNNTWTDASGVSAQVNQKLAYEYFNSTFQRHAIDNLDQSLISIIHVTENGKSMGNAYWNGRIMAYGDGDEDLSPLAGALDVAGHEMTHGVIQYTANLIYQFQSGALNESFADIFGYMVEPEDYLMGEDITTAEGKVALRDMMNPAATNVLVPQPAHMDDFLNWAADKDNGGVHYNSGIPTRAAMLILQSIGKTKTEWIYYRALSNYLTRNSEFIDGRNAVLQAAKDFKDAGQFGVSDADINIIKQAFDTVGITEGSGTPGGDDDDVPPIEGGQSIITFMNSAGEIGYIDITDINNLSAALFEDENATARVSQGDFAQLSTPASGGYIYFVNQQGRLAAIEVSNGQVSVFNLYLFEDGDLWNVSVSPDESVIALVSSNRNDPALYFFDGTDIIYVELLPEGTQEGQKVETIKYPDVVTWSPNVDVPLVAFDAYNEMGSGDQLMSFWGIYEIDFSTQKIYTFLPPQPENISVGNIAYSSTNPDVFAYNIIDYETESWDVVLGDYDAGTLEELDIETYSLGGVYATDAQRPSFSADDNQLAFTSPATNNLLILDVETRGMMYITFPVPIYNPRWFVYGGTVVDAEEEAELPLQASLSGNYPNPFRTSTTLSFSLPAAGEVRLDVFDALGRRITTLVDGIQQAGTHEVTFSAQGLSSGMYFARLQAAGKIFTTRMVVMK